MAKCTSGIFVLLFSLLIFNTSCTKEELISQEIIRDFKIDTLFYKGLDIDEFYLGAHPSQPDPFVADSSIYFVALDAAAPYEHVLYKIDIHSGDIIWKWKDYISGDDGRAGDLNYSNGKLMYSTHEYGYLLDASTGNILYTYTPPNNLYLRGSELHSDKIFVTYSDADGASLVEMNADGSNAVLIHSYARSANYNPLALQVEVLGDGSNKFISYKITNGKSLSANSSLFISRLQKPYKFYEFGQVPYHNPTPSSVLFSDDRLYTLSGSGKIDCFRFYPYDQLIWTSKFHGNKLHASTQNLYVSGVGLRIFDKKSGKVKFSDPHFPKVFGINKDIIITIGNPGLRIYDAKTGAFLKQFGNAYNTFPMVRVSENEFFFANSDEGGRIGKLRITPVP